MFVRYKDMNGYFATHKVVFNKSLLGDLSLDPIYLGWNGPSDKWLAWSSDDKDAIEAYLTTKEIAFTTTEIPPTTAQSDYVTAHQGEFSNARNIIEKMIAASIDVSNLES